MTDPAHPWPSVCRGSIQCEGSPSLCCAHARTSSPEYHLCPTKAPRCSKNPSGARADDPLPRERTVVSVPRRCHQAISTALLLPMGDVGGLRRARSNARGSQTKPLATFLFLCRPPPCLLCLWMQPSSLTRRTHWRHRQMVIVWTRGGLMGSKNWTNKSRPRRGHEDW